MDATVGNRDRTRALIIPVGLVLTAAIYALDLSLPLGVAGGVPYVAVVLLSLWSPNPRHTLIAASLGSGLTVAGCVLSPVGGVPWMVVVNRVLAICAIWVTAILVLRRKRDEFALQEARDTLETQVAERTADLAETGRALRASEERFRRAVVEAPIPIMIHAEDGEVVQINTAWTELTGFTHDEIPTIGDWTERAYGQRRHDVQAIVDELYALDRRVDKGEFAVGTKQGERRIWNFFAAPLGCLHDGRRTVVNMAVDVTVRKQVEDALCDREKQYARAEEVGNFGHWRHDFETDRAAWSRQTYRIFGLDPETFEPTFEAFLSRVHADDRVAVQREARRAVAKGDSPDVEYRIVRPDGTVRVIHSVAEAQADGNGQATRLVGTVHDITDRKRAEEALRRAHDELEQRVAERTAELRVANQKLEQEIAKHERTEAALRESEGRLRAVYQHEPAAATTWQRRNGDFVLIDFNQAAMAFIQGGIAELERATAREFYADRPDIVVDMQRCFDDQQPLHRELPYRMRTTGEQKELFNTYAFVPPDLVLIHSEDITDRKRAEFALRESEVRLRAVFASTHDPMFTIDQAGRVQSASDSVRRVFGWEPGELVGQNIRVLMPEPYRSSPDDNSADCIRTGQTTILGKPRELEAVRKDGSVFPCEITVWRVDLPGRDEPIFTGIVRDITDRKQADDERRRPREELAHVARLIMMGEMAAGIAHELNQPLAAIVNYVDAAMLNVGRREAGSEVLLADLEHVAGQAVRAGTIIRRLRNLARKQEPRSEPVQVNDLVQEVLELIDAEIRMAGVTLRLGLNERLPDVKADAIQIQQVLINLLRNGLDAMAETPRERRRLILRSAQAEPDLVEVAVSDTGCGIDAEHQDRVFEPFFTTKTDGMGMGLSINRSIIEAHGGRLWATSNPAGGTTFHMTLPIALGDESNGNSTDSVRRG